MCSHAPHLVDQTVDSVDNVLRKMRHSPDESRHSNAHQALDVLEPREGVLVIELAVRAGLVFAVVKA